MIETTPTLTAQIFFNSLMNGDLLTAREHMKRPDLDVGGLRFLCTDINVFEAFASTSLDNLTFWRASNTPDQAYSPVYRLEVLEFILEHQLASVAPDVFLQQVLRGIDPDCDDVSPLEDQTVVRLLDRAFQQNLYGIATPIEQHLFEAYQRMTWGYYNGVLTHALQWGWFDFMFKDIVADDLYNTFIQNNWKLENFLPKVVIEAMPWRGSSSIPGVFNTYERVMDVRPELFDWSDTQRHHIFESVCNMILNEWATNVAEKLLPLNHTHDTGFFMERINDMVVRNQKILDQRGGVLLAILNRQPELLVERIAHTPDGQEWTVYDLLTQGDMFSKSWSNPDSTYAQDCINTIEQLESARQQRVLNQHVTNIGVRSKTARI